MARGISEELLVIVGPPTHPDCIGGRQMIGKGLERLCSDWEQGSVIDFLLANSDQLLSKRCECWTHQWLYQLLKSLQQLAGPGHPAGTNFDDFHFICTDGAII